MIRSLLFPAALALLAALPRTQSEPRFDAAGFVQSHCAECHAAEDPEAGLDLIALAAIPPRQDAVGDWLAVRDVLESGEMPPDDEPQPTDAERTALLIWLDAAIARLERAGPLDPGRVTMRRLSRFEYRNTVRDLLDVRVDVQSFPTDDLGYGFDNVGDALSLSTLHLEKYATAAERIAEAAFPDPDPETPPVRRLQAERAICSLGDRARSGDHVALFSRGTVTWQVELPRPGRYEVRIRAFGRQAGDQPARMDVRIDGLAPAVVDVHATRAEPEIHSFEVEATTDRLNVAATFVNDFYQPDHPDPAERDRNLYLDWCEVEGPLDRREPTWAWQRFAGDDDGRGTPMARARPILRALIERAWRRPVHRGEVTRLARLVHQAVEDEGEDFESGLRWAVQAALVSPHFLFRIEPVQSRSTAPSATVAEPLDAFALATRLSYFVWSSSPDDRLFAAAKSGELNDLPILVTEARRMLRSPRAEALAENFAAQWLELRRLGQLRPDPDRYPSFSAKLARDMRTETQLFFDAVRREGRPARELLDSDFTFLNQRLAEHYEIDGVTGPQFRRVTLDDPRRGGILTHASVLSVTSNATRTSPVRRGKWILENVLDDAPPPPPPGSDSLVGESLIDSAASLREQLAAHRADPQCSGCHDRMDPLGFALENFDAIGRWRSMDGGLPIDASGTLPDGREIDGPAALKRALRSERAFVRGLSRKLFVYGVGRAPTSSDDALAIEKLLRDLPAEPTIDDVILGVVQLEAFRRRRIVE